MKAPARCVFAAALALFTAAFGSSNAPAADPPLTASERATIATVLRAATPPAGSKDEALVAALLHHARGETGQRLRPVSIDRRWTVQPPRRDLAAEFRAARSGGSLAGWLSTLSPASAEYTALQLARSRYAGLLAAGGWPAVPGKRTLRIGDPADELPVLRSRLAAEGYPSREVTDAAAFDPELEAALRDFQLNHGLEPDGVLGPETRRALNVSALERLSQIDANLERRRWLPRSLPADRLEVDTGGAEATLFRADRPVLRMRIVVGDPRHATPMFVSQLESVIFNPPWNVPASIAVAEILPRTAKDPGFLSRNGFRFVGGRLQQRPGPNNALGVIKFDLPSPFGVYLHDTPGKAAFARANRALSHGCMRLEKPRELALELLAPQGGTREFIEGAIAAGATRPVRLERPLPLYVLHWTVRVDGEGRLLFQPDVYGWDRKLVAALRNSTPRN